MAHSLLSAQPDHLWNRRILVSNTCDKVCGVACAESSANPMESKSICQANHSSWWSGLCNFGVSQAFRVGWRLEDDLIAVSHEYRKRGFVLSHDTILAGGKDPSHLLPTGCNPWLQPSRMNHQHFLSLSRRTRIKMIKDPEPSQTAARFLSLAIP